jgi:hypothetical protein
MEKTYPIPCHQHPKGGPLTDLHVRTCVLSGLQTIQHDGFQDVVHHEILQGVAHLPGVSRKDTTPFVEYQLHQAAVAPPPVGTGARGRAKGEREMDLVLRANTLMVAEDDPLAGKRVLIDVSFVEPLAATYVAKAAHQQGFCAAKREGDKRDHYQPELKDPTATPCFDADLYVLVPFAVESYGTVGMEAQTLLKKLACHTAGGPQEFDLLAYNESLREMRVRMAVAIQRLPFDRSRSHYARACKRPPPLTIRRSASLMG